MPLTVEIVFEVPISEVGLYESHTGVFFCNDPHSSTRHCNERNGDLYAIPLHIQRNQTPAPTTATTGQQAFGFSGQNYMAGVGWALEGFAPVAIALIAGIFIMKAIGR